MVDHLRVKDNLLSTSPVKDVLPCSIVKMNDVGAASQHPCLKDSIQLLSLFLPQHECVVRNLQPAESHVVIPLQQLSSVQGELETKSLDF